MKFTDIIKETRVLLQESGQLTYRTLKREFGLDDDALEDLKFELIEGQELAVDKDGKSLVWTGDDATLTTPSKSPISSQPPATYTPQHLAERIRSEQAAMESRGAADGERKTITALFADLKGSTALIEGLDPEDARAIIDPALQLMMDAVHRYDGYVAQALGDGIFALFGAPIAHEDHPQRALYAALRMQEEMRGYSDHLRLSGGAPLQMRVGINTGEVVVRSIRKDDLHTDYVPVGHSTNIAARMEQMANPGSIVVTEYTHRLTEGYFEFNALGGTQVKGVDTPLNVYEVLGAGPLRTRLQVSALRGLTRFVGRHSEMDQLRQALEQAKEGHGQIVGVMGEPGLGKSRLFYEFKLTSQSGLLVLEAFAVSHGKASPYLPLIELLKEYFQIEPGGDERSRRQKIIGQVLELDRSLEDILPYLFSLLGIEDSESSLQQMDAQIRRQRTFEALKTLFLRESLNQPLILIFEDLHWIDTETQGFLDILSDSVASTNLLLLVNYRPEYKPEWGQKTYYTQLSLAPLGTEEAEELLNFLLGNAPSLNRLKALILERTEGTPFFMEEVVQTLAEEGALLGERGNFRVETAPTELHISPTVQGVLAARIDRLSTEEKDLLQQLAVIGRQFPLSLVKQVVTQSEDEVYRLLSTLQAKEFLYEQPAFPEVEYLFKHALTQEVAYGTVLHEQRKALHERTGQAIEMLYQEKLDERYAELTHHYQRSDNTEKAVEYLHLAGQQAVERSANEDALNYFMAALEVLKTLPDTMEHRQQELTFQAALGPVLIVTKGYGARDVGVAFTRARELCEQVGEAPQLFPVLRGLWAFHVGRAEIEVTREIGGQLLGIARRSQDSGQLVEACYALGASLFWRGEAAPALQLIQEGLAVYDPQRHRPHLVLYGQDPGVLSLLYATNSLWLLGYADQAHQRAQESLTLARDLKHPYSLSAALMITALFHYYRREPQATQQRMEEVRTLSTEYGFSYNLGIATIWCGWARSMQGQEEEGLGQIREGIAAFRATGAELAMTQNLISLAEVCGKLGQFDEGLRVVADALQRVDRTHERFWEAELHRFKGELLLAQEGEKAKGKGNKGDESEAQACFQHALDVARRQSAKSLELRAAMGLSRLWQKQGKQAEAHDLLAPVYDWFTEGFDTADLKDAKALLYVLSEDV